MENEKIDFDWQLYKSKKYNLHYRQTDARIIDENKVEDSNGDLHYIRVPRENGLQGLVVFEKDLFYLKLKDELVEEIQKLFPDAKITQGYDETMALMKKLGKR